MRRTSAILVALVTLLVAAPAAIAAPRPHKPEPPRPSPVDQRVFVLGDSVMLGAQGVVASRLASSGWTPNVFAAESLHIYNSGPIVDANLFGNGDVVVIALGANDGISAQELSVWLDGLMAHLQGVPQVFWVNLRQFTDWVPAANAVIADAAHRYPNLAVIDWDARATPDPGLVYGDGLHLNDAGAAAMAELVGSTLDAYVADRIEQVRVWEPRAEKAARVARF